MVPPGACAHAVNAPLSFLSAQYLRLAPRKHHHLKKQETNLGERNSTILIVILLPSTCAAPWCLLVLTRMLRRRQYLFLVPSACAGCKESIISKKQN